MGKRIFWNEEKQAWDIEKDPYAIIHIQTEEEFNNLNAAVEHFNKRGHWIMEREPDGTPYCVHCSVCDPDFRYIDIKSAFDFCPHCGVKMDTEFIREKDRKASR